MLHELREASLLDRVLHNGVVLLRGADSYVIRQGYVIMDDNDRAPINRIVYLSIGPGLMGHTGINTVLRWIAPITVSIILLFEPVVGGIIGWLWQGELTLGMWTLLGGPLMLAGAIIVTMEEYSTEIAADAD